MQNILHFRHLNPVAMAEWLRTLIFSTLNRLLSHCYGFEPSSDHL